MHLDWSTLFHVEFTLPFLLAALNIVFINIILSGDNAVLIAMAVRGLDNSQRQKGIIFGTAVAVLMRIVLTFFVSLLLGVPYLKFVGGILILWIATHLFIGSDDEESGVQVTTLLKAIQVIIIADLTMSLDNVLGVAGAAGGNMFLLLFGLGVSIPIVIFTSNLISSLMDKYPIIIVLGAVILGRVGGEMMITDPAIHRMFHPNTVAEYSMQIACAAGVIVLGKIMMRRRAQAMKSARSAA